MLFSLALLLVACSEYDLGSEDKTAAAGADTASGTVATEAPGSSCDAGVVPGFQASINDECVNAIATGTFDPVVKWSTATFADGGSANVMMTPIVTSLTDDNRDGVVDESDIPDIVFVAFGGVTSSVRAISGDDGHELWAWNDYSLQMTGGVAAGDLDGDGRVEIVAMLVGGVAILGADGAPRGRQEGLVGHIYGISDVPSISDMNHDGSPEIIVGNAILTRTGAILGLGGLGMGGRPGNVGTCSFAADLDRDGVEEVVTGNAAYHMDGSVVWSNGAVDGYPALGDFDLDGTPEIVVTSEGVLRRQTASGAVVWTVPIPGAMPSQGGPPTIADFDGDGAPEIGVAAGTRYSVIEGDGSVRWQHATDDNSSGNTASSVFDFEGDGAAEVVYADQTRLWVFSGVDGTVKLESTEHSNGTWLEYPVIADVDADGHADIVVPQEVQYGGYTGITVFQDRANSWQPGRRTWNQHAYFITNVGDDGGIPRTADENWMSYNSFRSGDLTSGQGTASPDLALELSFCSSECPGKLVVHVNPGNKGFATVSPGARPTVALWAETVTGELLIGETPLASALVAGAYQDSVAFDVAGLDWSGLTALRAEVHSQEPECDAANNIARSTGPFCE